MSVITLLLIQCLGTLWLRLLSIFECVVRKKKKKKISTRKFRYNANKAQEPVRRETTERLHMQSYS